MKLVTRKWRNDFKNQNNEESWYDLFEDFSLIESSFNQQYGIRLRKELGTMKWGEFTSLLEGINAETVLGNVVRIRSEKDPKKIKDFTKQERQIRNEWLNKQAKNISKNDNDYKQAMENFKNMFKGLAKKGGNNK